MAGKKKTPKNITENMRRYFKRAKENGYVRVNCIVPEKDADLVKRLSKRLREKKQQADKEVSERV